jgi:hypothetical protein
MRATEVAWLEFRSSLVWQDMRESIEQELAILIVELEDETASLDRLRWIQGKLIAMRHFLELPNLAIEAFEMDRSTNKTKEEDDGR